MTVFLRIQTTTSTTQDPEIYSTALHNYIKVKVLRELYRQGPSPGLCTHRIQALSPQDPCFFSNAGTPARVAPGGSCPLTDVHSASTFWPQATGPLGS